MKLTYDEFIDQEIRNLSEHLVLSDNSIYDYHSFYKAYGHIGPVSLTNVVDKMEDEGLLREEHSASLTNIGLCNFFKIYDEKKYKDFMMQVYDNQYSVRDVDRYSCFHMKGIIDDIAYLRKGENKKEVLDIRMNELYDINKFLSFTHADSEYGICDDPKESDVHYVPYRRVRRAKKK